DRRAPRGESRERFERPERFATPAIKSSRPEKKPDTAAPADKPARPATGDAPQPAEKHIALAPAVKPSAAVKPEVQKTFSDAEILGSVKPEPRKPVVAKPPGKSTPPWARQEPAETKAVQPPQKSRPPAGDYTRLHMNLGEATGVVP